MNKFIGKIIAFAMLCVCMSANTCAAADGFDWEKGVIRVTGMSVAPTGQSTKGAFAKAHIRQAARMDAKRQLAEILIGVTVDTSTDITKYLVTSETISTSVVMDENHPLSKISAHKVHEAFLKDGGDEVTLELALFGRTDSAALAFYPQYTPLPLPNPKTNVATRGNYTGVIVDFRDTGFAPGFEPTISDGTRTIYCYKNVDRDTLVTKGAVYYAQDINQAARARLGDNPLFVRGSKIETKNEKGYT